MQQTDQRLIRSGNGTDLPATRSGMALRPALWLLAGCLACLFVVLLNGTPLFYYDTNAYLQKGQDLLSYVFPDDPAPATDAAGATAGAGAGAAPVDADAHPAVKAPVGVTRSTVYAIFMGLLARVQLVETIILFNTVLVLGTAWLVTRVILRACATPVARMPLIMAPVLVCAASALPFYVGYLMPDIFAPVLILLVALATGFGRYMTRLDIAGIVLLGAFASTTHPSHFALVVLMIPLVAIAARILSRTRWWLAPLILLCIAGLDLAQQKTFKIAVQTQTGRSTTHLPLLTARLIADGPGWSYLENRCPNDEIATCRLHEALGVSDNPMRFTPSHIVFETSPELGSYRLLPPEDQAAVDAEQFDFFFDVLMARPFHMTWAFMRNTLKQATRVNVKMTLQTDEMISRLEHWDVMRSSVFEHGQLTRDRFWLPAATALQATVYGAALAVLALLVAWPAALGARMRVFVIMVVLGILVNAFVCGALSQPATRYGARVIWLLPYTAVLALMFSPVLAPRLQRWRHRPSQG